MELFSLGMEYSSLFVHVVNEIEITTINKKRKIDFQDNYLI